jgi:hypothetical protein
MKCSESGDLYSVKNKKFTSRVFCGAVHTLQQGVLSSPNVVGLMVLVCVCVCVMSHVLTGRVQPSLCRFAWNLQMFDSIISRLLEF